MEMSEKQIVDFWFDPLCPFAWLTSRWMLEVEQVREVETRFHPMSLALLNAGREGLPDDYRKMMETVAWYGARAAIAVQLRHGDAAVREFYTAIGTRYHLHDEPRSPETVRAALVDCGLDSSIADAVTGDQWDAELAASHHAGMDPVGNDVGTPVIRIDGHSIFGPVLSPIPRGEAAGRLFDAVSICAGYDEFFELKRTRTVGPIFT
ncbi:MAG: DsbA family protein [Propionibacteriaceae bacterium]|jgi:2-hydroxychromene-2-carboxylate isomerase|nr:DsbA family protein [Propionibacteriaceae bacterium]